MYKFDITKQVPLICQEKWGWGGAACCQMAMAGYPVKPCPPKQITQTKIWNYIQTYNKEPGYNPKWGYGWDADPYAVTKTLNDKCPPQHKWIDVSGTNKMNVLYTILRYMAKYKYPALVCTFGHDYWVTVVYYKTSDNPLTVTTPTLNWIGFYGVGTLYSYYTCKYHEVAGWKWLNHEEYWKYNCCGKAVALGWPDPQCGKIWSGKWVAIAEPPEVEGSIQVEAISRIGDTIMNPRDIVQIAEEHLLDRTREESEFLLGRPNSVRAAEPLLVREIPIEEDDTGTETHVKYYLVPFIDRDEVTRTQVASLSIIVNAFTGLVEELCVFAEPVRYLTENEARRIASLNLGLSQRETKTLQTELVYNPFGQYASCVFPTWRLTKEKTILDISQDGVITKKLAQPHYFKGS